MRNNTAKQSTTLPVAAPKVRILPLILSPEAVFERAINGERDAALDREFHKTWVDATGAIVELA